MAYHSQGVSKEQFKNMSNITKGFVLLNAQNR